MALLTQAYWRWLALFLVVTTAGRVTAQPSREYDLKAAFLYNFAAFVDWPPQAFEDAQAPFVIGVIGADPFGPVLDELVRGERAKDRPLVVRRLNELHEIRGCHILFISRTERYRLYDILWHTRGHAILTVSDLPGFTSAGGMIGFRTEQQRIVLQVNPAAAAAAELVISSKLLRVARVAPEAGGLRP